MQLWVSEENIPFFAALASPIRIKILERLAKSDANIKELAEEGRGRHQRHDDFAHPKTGGGGIGGHIPL